MEPTEAWGRYASDALQLANAVDCSSALIGAKQQFPERLAADFSARSCNWFFPVFDKPTYGGLMTCFRIAEALKTSGVTQRFLLCGPCDTEEIRKKIGGVFPKLADSEIHSLDSPSSLGAIPSADYAIATLWTTAYVVLGVTNAGLKLYMIQDFEPLFYPAGSTYAQAELTYRFGLIAIANTTTLANIYRRNYGGRAIELTPQIDPKVFHARGRSAPSRVRRLFYYARPDIPRNAFELAAVALRLLKERMGDKVEIVVAGAEFDPTRYGLKKGVVEPLGMLPYERTGDLYRSCHAGLSLMMTMHPSYLPLELMSCGAIAVTNHNEANDWLLHDKVNCIRSWPTAYNLANTLEGVLTNFEQHKAIRTNGLATAAAHCDWVGEINRIVTQLLSLDSKDALDKLQ